MHRHQGGFVVQKGSLEHCYQEDQRATQVAQPVAYHRGGGIEARAEVVAEDAHIPQLVLHTADVYHSRLASGQHTAGGGRVTRGQAQAPGEVVARADGDKTQSPDGLSGLPGRCIQAGLDDTVEHLVGYAIAPSGGDDLPPLADGLDGLPDGRVLSGRLHDFERRAFLGQRSADDLARLPACSASRERVEDNFDCGHHSSLMYYRPMYRPMYRMGKASQRHGT